MRELYRRPFMAAPAQSRAAMKAGIRTEKSAVFSSPGFCSAGTGIAQLPPERVKLAEVAISMRTQTGSQGRCVIGKNIHINGGLSFIKQGAVLPSSFPDHYSNCAVTALATREKSLERNERICEVEGFPGRNNHLEDIVCAFLLFL
jgi:hypothetical protein